MKFDAPGGCDGGSLPVTRQATSELLDIFLMVLDDFGLFATEKAVLPG